jgi:phosphoribosylanthranilate isomerase
MSTLSKICGLSTPETVDCAIESGTSMVGFVFFPPSPRSISIVDASTLAARVPVGIQKVALTVNADDDFLTEIAENTGIDIFQLHGNEQPERVFEIRHKFGLPVIKALPVEDHLDLMVARGYDAVVDYFLFDSKPPRDASRPGGNATAFDWSLLKGFSLAKPWLLAGGLTPQNVSQAVEISGAQMVDVSSGVENAPGVKNLDKIRSFLGAIEIK